MIEENAQAPATALVNALGQTGLPDTVKGKVQRLVLRLIAGGPGFEYYQKARERLDVVEGKSRISNIVADEIGRQALLDPEFMERAKARLLGDMAQKQENIEAIASKAQEKIDAMPDAETEADANAPEPSQDWLNAFSREAELASSDELRERLADILAGEARKPGTFSRSTVRFIAELEREVLEGFQKLLPHRVGDAIIRGEDWNSGTWFNIAVAMEAEGLVTGSEGFTHRKVKLDAKGNGFLIGQNLSLTVKGTPESENQVGIFLLTRLGREVASLLPATDEVGALQRAAEFLRGKDGVDQIWLGGHVRLDAQNYHVTQALLLWDREHETAAAAE